MPWPLILVPIEQLPHIDPPPIGTCWYERAWLDWREAIAPNYLKHNAHRLPISVQLPCGAWCVDLRQRSNEKGWYGDGWEVVGELPFITVAPSINVDGGWHGYITHGEISEDLEGRKFS
jgi:hypothetical protein